MNQEQPASPAPTHPETGPPRLRIGVPREVHPGERRVAATPATVEKIRKLGLEVIVQAGAGEGASFPDGPTPRPAPRSSRTRGAVGGATSCSRCGPQQEPPTRGSTRPT